MPIDFATVASYNPPTYQGGQVWISWVPTESGLYWQIYINGVLSWHGTALGAWLLVPPTGVNRVVVGSVDVADITTDFGAELPAAPLRRVQVNWQGGTFEGIDLVGFYVYMSPTAGSPIDFTKIASTVIAFPGGNPVSSTQYSWTSPSLVSGLWSFGVVAYDSAGNLSSPQTVTESISVPPLPPALFADNTRLHYIVLDGGEAPGTLPRVELFWNESPG